MTNLRPPRRAERIAALLGSFPGVVGVGWGQAMRGGRFGQTQALTVHVRHKRPPDLVPPEEWLPQDFDGLPVDIIEVGLPRVHVLDHSDMCVAPGGENPRRATVTAMASKGKRVFALLSGHATLPYKGGNILRDLGTNQPPAALSIVDGDGGFYRASVVAGRFGNGRAVDWGLAELADVEDRSTYHMAAGDTPPLQVRRTPLNLGERLWHYSRLESPGRRRRIAGRLRQVMQSPTEFRLPDGLRTAYTDILVIESHPQVAFSEEGDSGSLVVDERGAAVGTVLGASADYELAYVLRIDALTGDLKSVASHFFQT